MMDINAMHWKTCWCVRVLGWSKQKRNHTIDWIPNIWKWQCLAFWAVWENDGSVIWTFRFHFLHTETYWTWNWRNQCIHDSQTNKNIYAQIMANFEFKTGKHFQLLFQRLREKSRFVQAIDEVWIELIENLDTTLMLYVFISVEYLVVFMRCVWIE